MNNLSLRSVLSPLKLTSVRALENITRSAVFTKKPDESVRRQAYRALFKRHQQRLGGVRGKAGLQMQDLQVKNNRITKPYSGGVIELMDFTDGPQGFQKYRAEVRFVGFRCHQESEGGDGDEPYFIVGILDSSSDPEISKTFGPFSFVHTGNNTSLETFVTKTAQPPFSIVVVAMDRDSGSPAEASAKVEKALNDASAKLTLALPLLGVEPTVGAYIQSVLNIFGGTISDGLSALFGMGDDLIGQTAKHFFDFDLNVVKWTTPPPLTAPDFHSPFNVEMVLDNGEGGRYSVFFQVTLMQDTSKIV